jgi:hypothetical protein
MNDERQKEPFDAFQISPQGEEIPKSAEGLSLHSSLVDPSLLPILEERFNEAQLCLEHSPMATIMLCGSLLEGLLLGIANKRPAEFNRSPQSPKDENGKTKPFKDWGLAQFIDVAHGLGILRLDVKNFGHHLRNFRNYIHPYQQMKEDFHPDRYTAEMCLVVAKAAIHNLNTSAAPKKQKVVSSNWTQHSDATYLALAVLIGAWNEKSKCDIEAITQVIGIGYDDWLQKAREILICPDSPLSLKNGIWKVVNRVELWNQLGSRILDQNLDTFKSLAVSVLKEPDPAFELPVEERYAASLHGKELAHSPALRKGLAEGVAILGSNPSFLSNCSRGKAEATGVLVIREILEEADWVVWGSLNDLLPTLAEAAPGEFLNAVEAALKMDPCPFDQLFAQEGNGITGGNYLTGLLWALEGLAWDEIYLVRVCVVLGELASHDPGGQWANRPINTIATTLLPWFPQTLAPIEKRKIAVQTLCREWPDIGWKLIIHLLPNQFQTTVGAHKPTWRKIIPEDWEEGATQKDHWDQVSFYAELAVSSADHDLKKLAELVEHFDDLPKPAFDQLLDVLASDAILGLPEDQRLPIWDHLTKFTTKHRKFAEANWALPDDLVASIKAVADKLAPTDPFNLYQHIFSDRDHDLFDEKGNWEEQKRWLDERRDKAIIEIFQKDGIDAVIQFARAVASPEQVGYALGSMSETSIEQALFPEYLDSEDKKLTLLSGGFVWRRHHDKGWAWSDHLDRSTWSQEQIGCFLTCLPFKKETWERAGQWLGDAQNEYWKRTGANAYQADEGLDIAIDKLIEFGRPHAAIFCLDRMRHDKHAIDPNQCVRALLAGVSSEEPSHSMDHYRITELIKLLQQDDTVSEEELFKVEWAYLPLLDRHRNAAPKYLESRLASDPEFFCEVLRLIYRSKKKEKNKEPTEKQKTIAGNAWRLLREWRKVPGTLEDKRFDVDKFAEWIKTVKEVCAESGHLEVALITIGGVLIHSPADPNGLWMHQAVAEALNARDSEDMRRGYSTGIFNSRGVRTVDPTGKPERELAEHYRQKAEDVENAGFHRLAVTLRGLADGYDREAERIIEDFKTMNKK